MKEGLPVHRQSNIVASILRPSFFDLYDEFFSLTGTLGEESEQNEMRSNKYTKSIHLMSNRIQIAKKKKNREKKKMTVYSEERKNKLHESRKEVQFSFLFIQSMIHKNYLTYLKHIILNDQQLDDEDFILDHAAYVPI